MNRPNNSYTLNLRRGILFDLFMSIIVLLILVYYLKKGFHFQSQQVFFSLILLVPAYFYFYKEHRLILRRFSASYTTYKFEHAKRHIIKFLALKFCFLGIVIAIADPVLGIEETKVPLKSVDIMVCLDLSRSMDVKDVENKSRLESGVNLLKSLVKKLSGERIGLCIFAQNAVVQLPLTRDYERFKLMLNEASTNHFSNQGTNIGGALNKAMLSFEKIKSGHSILLITDGEDHASSLTAIVDSLLISKIKLLSIAVGTESGGPILQSDKKTMRLDASGNIIISKVDLSMVKSLASQTKGSWFHITEAYPAPDRILTEINLGSKVYSRDLALKVEKRAFYIPLFFAFLSFCVYTLVPFRVKKNK